VLSTCVKTDKQQTSNRQATERLINKSVQFQHITAFM